MRKKFLALLLTIVLLFTSFTLFGCGNDGDEESRDVVRFAMLSDIHLQVEDEKAVRNFKAAVEQCTRYAGGSLDAVLVSGDLLDTMWYSKMQYEDETINYDLYYGDMAFGDDDYLNRELDFLVDVIDETVPSDTEFIYCLGNHDQVSLGTKLLSGNPYGAVSACVKHDYGYYKDGFKRSTRNYFSSDQPDHSGLNVNLDYIGARYVRLGGVHFISLSNAVYYNANSENYNQLQLDWLSATLEYIDTNYPNDNIMLITHMPILNTLPYTFDSKEASDKIEDVLKDYPQVTVFTGHFHQTTYNERSFWSDRGFTAVEVCSVKYTSSTNYLGGGSEGYNVHYAANSNSSSQGLLVTVDKDGSVKIERMDFTSGTKIGTDWELPSPSSAERATKYKNANRLSENATPEFGDEKPRAEVVNGYLNVRWNAAEDPDNDVWAYIVTASYNNGSTKKLIVSAQRSTAEPSNEYYCSFADAANISTVTVTPQDSLLASGASYEISSYRFGSASAVTSAVDSSLGSSDAFTLGTVQIGDYKMASSRDFVANDGVINNYKSSFANGIAYVGGVYGKDYSFSFNTAKLRCNRANTSNGISRAVLQTGACLASWEYNGKIFSIIAQLQFNKDVDNVRTPVYKMTYYLVQTSNASVGWATVSQIKETVALSQQQRETLSSETGGVIKVERTGSEFKIYLDGLLLDTQDFGGSFYEENTFVPFTADTTAAFGVATAGGEAYFSNLSASVTR